MALPSFIVRFLRPISLKLRRCSSIGFAKQGVELVVLARYMQILSKEFLEKVGCPVINIHHSFLPSFAGESPIRKPTAEVSS